MRISSLVRPSLKVHRLGRTDADQNSQDFHTRGSQRHRGIEAVATLFYCWKMEAGRIRNRLKEVGILCIVVRPGNCRVLSNRQGWNRLWESEIGVKIRVMRAAPVPSPPTCI